MTELFHQNELFHALKLQPISEKKFERCEREIEKNLIRMNNIKECHVKLNKINTEAVNIKKPRCGRALRQRKKRHCKMCCNLKYNLSKM